MENYNVFKTNELDKCSPITYIKKEQFIQLLQNLDFIAVESADIEFITAFLLDTEKNTINPKGFKISII